ncbi:MAG TPA: hypothetical protein VHJ83_02385 [Micromonosporaceae bacterium]|nr:hypothetical protein [Micromonosporaceae bacterium]
MADIVTELESAAGPVCSILKNVVRAKIPEYEIGRIAAGELAWMARR